MARASQDKRDQPGFSSEVTTEDHDRWPAQLRLDTIGEVKKLLRLDCCGRLRLDQRHDLAV